MGKLHTEIDAEMGAFLRAQHVFFVATAPLAADRHLNLSPKGLDTFALLGPREVAYLDLVGSGAETLAHLRENGRIVLMFCAFDGRPRIVRLHGRGRAVEPQDPEFAALAARFPAHPATRSVVRAELDRISDSCGYGVPRLEYKGERDQLTLWADRKGEDGLRKYVDANNLTSIDGLPAARSRA
jgi:hypothetical protein